MERLVFSYGTSRHQAEAPARPAGVEQVVAGTTTGIGTAPAAAVKVTHHAEPRDWAFIGLMVFTGLLFFRPQDLITPLRALHLAEISAVLALGSLIAGLVRAAACR